MIDKKAKTKILATLGPATGSKEEIKKIIEAGADAVRLNFSHSNHEYFENIFQAINDVCVELSMPIATLLDLQGPKIRIGELSEPEIEIKSGESIEITIDDLKGTKDKISTSYKLLPDDAEIGDKILIDDGLIKLSVTSITKTSVICKVVDGGILKPKKGMNLPGIKVSAPSVTAKDYNDLEFAMKHRVDFIALSFVRRAQDILELRKWLKEHNYKTPIIAKIEKPEAVTNFEEILEVADGIMVARGDLGVEMEAQEVPIIQKKIIRRCNEVGKLVITATQMLESMIQNPVPTRAEASDVANAVLDGTDVVMLSGETSVGKHPAHTVGIMNNILLTAEAHPSLRHKTNYEIPKDLSDNLFDSTGRAVAGVSEQIQAKVIAVFTHQGRKAKMIAKFRPKADIIAFSDKFETLNTLNLYWGIQSFFIDNIDDEDNAINRVNEILRKQSIIENGDVIIYTAGAPYTEKGRRTWMRFAVFS